jgi:hypothetical protein
MTVPPRNICLGIPKLLTMIGASADEAETARQKLLKLLDKYGRSFTDLPEILVAQRPFQIAGFAAFDAKAWRVTVARAPALVTVRVINAGVILALPDKVARAICFVAYSGNGARHEPAAA